ncbi:DUF1427 family protein [Streptomyces sp. NPDC047061]|uniref:DUF1427 family protein n=1 Tax=Streptomyces sp. NPDC047061 TaxID=3154605 RepID=UPI0033E68511
MSRVLRRHLASAATGLLAGALYHLLGTASPAPPWAALAGLAGILLGERASRSLLDRLRRYDGDSSLNRARPAPTASAAETGTDS